jgi:hypothetical protein
MTTDSQLPPIEPAYSPQQIAKAWNLSVETVRKIFEDEPGVFKITLRRLVKRGGRPYVTLRVPENVVERVARKQGRG